MAKPSEACDRCEKCSPVLPPMLLPESLGRRRLRVVRVHCLQRRLALRSASWRPSALGSFSPTRSSTTIDSSLRERPIIYWRTPQFFEHLKAGDRILIWRSGKEAGVVGWGVLLSEPRYYDLSHDDDPFNKPGAFPGGSNEWHVPVRVWPSALVPKQEVAAAIPENRIITNPMGTVFRLNADDEAALGPLLNARGYDLARPADTNVPLLPVLPEAEVEAEQEKTKEPAPSVARC